MARILLVLCEFISLSQTQAVSMVREGRGPKEREGGVAPGPDAGQPSLVPYTLVIPQPHLPRKKQLWLPVHGAGCYRGGQEITEESVHVLQLHYSGTSGKRGHPRSHGCKTGEGVSIWKWSSSLPLATMWLI